MLFRELQERRRSGLCWKRNLHTGETKQNEVAHKMYAQPPREYLVSYIVDYFSSRALLICFSFCFISRKQIKQTTM